MKEEYTSWEYFKEDTPINIKVKNNKTIQSSERSANVPREQRTAILTFDNGQRVRAEITLPGTDKPVWHTELERRIVNDFNKAPPRAVHKLVKVHLLRTQSSQPFILRNIQL